MPLMSEMDTKISISSAFDSGNIEVVSADDPRDIQLRIRPDPYCQSDETAHFQWFHFRCTGGQGKVLLFKLVNAGQSSFPVAWPNYAACCSYDTKDWFRINTTWDEERGIITMEHYCEHDSMYVAYFAPYSHQRHLELVAQMQSKPNVRVIVLGQTLDGRDIDLLIIGDPGPTKKNVWIVARQHPGESMAEWFMEGFLETLTNPHNGFSLRSLTHAVFYVVPNMNVDGSIRGHLRTNALGANLNREWQHPTLEHSPEVFHVLNKMEETGVDFFADCHGDEEQPFNFVAGIEGIPSFDNHLRDLSQRFTAAFERATPDFQKKPGYEVDPPGQANLSIGSNAVGERFKCLSFTLEMPFKDTEDAADTVHGWSPERAKCFGAAFLGPIYEVLPVLRDVQSSRSASKQEA